MNVLITGGAGFIGSHTADEFSAKGWQVRILDNLSTGSRDNLQPSWEFVEGDIMDAVAVDRAVDGMDAVVHLAAFISVPESLRNHEICFQTNVIGTHTLLDSSVQHGVRAFVFGSSSAVFSDGVDAPRSVSECPGPISPYGVSKLEGEHLCEYYHGRGLRSVSLRFFNVYGPRQSVASDYAAVVPIFIRLGLAGRSLTIHGDGLQTRDFVFVQDVAAAIQLAAKSDAHGTYNLGHGEGTSVLEIAKRVNTLCGGGLSFEYAEGRDGDIRYSVADTGSTRTAIGWEPKYALDRGLAETLSWHQERI